MASVFSWRDSSSMRRLRLLRRLVLSPLPSLSRIGTANHRWVMHDCAVWFPLLGKVGRNALSGSLCIYQTMVGADHVRTDLAPSYGGRGFRLHAGAQAGLLRVGGQWADRRRPPAAQPSLRLQ